MNISKKTFNDDDDDDGVELKSRWSDGRYNEKQVNADQVINFYNAVSFI